MIARVTQEGEAMRQQVILRHCDEYDPKRIATILSEGMAAGEVEGYTLGSRFWPDDDAQRANRQVLERLLARRDGKKEAKARTDR